MGGTMNRKGGLGAALAMLALVLQICVPGGFMVSREAGAPALVVCTGHGALVTLADTHGAPAKVPAGDHGVCAFAGHGVTTLDAPATVIAATSVAFSAPPVSTPADPTPGRGLAAPPPPSQGPPLRTI
jgi:hypothetical protein